jgi:DNA-binding Xre family transcriptional regulator
MQSRKLNQSGTGRRGASGRSGGRKEPGGRGYDLGLKVAEKRGARDIRSVAAEIGIGMATLSRIERGASFRLETLLRICRWLEVDPGRFIDQRLAKLPSPRPDSRAERKGSH